jgi:hypothetical protein
MLHFMRPFLDRDTTLALLAAAAALALLARWGDGRRKRVPHGALALLPWHGLMFVALVGMLFMLVHLLSLLGAR